MFHLINFFLGFVGLGFLMVGSLFIYGGLPRTNLVTCQQMESQSTTCQDNRTVAGLITSETHISQVNNAQVVPARFGDTEGGTSYYQVNLTGKTNRITLEYLSEVEANQLAQKINHFIHTPTTELLTIQSHYGSWPHVLIGLFVVSVVLGLWASAMHQKQGKEKH